MNGWIYFSTLSVCFSPTLLLYFFVFSFAESQVVYSKMLKTKHIGVSGIKLCTAAAKAAGNAEHDLVHTDSVRPLYIQDKTFITIQGLLRQIQFHSVGYMQKNNALQNQLRPADVKSNFVPSHDLIISKCWETTRSNVVINKCFSVAARHVFYRHNNMV